MEFSERNPAFAKLMRDAAIVGAFQTECTEEDFRDGLLVMRMQIDTGIRAREGNAATRKTTNPTGMLPGKLYCPSRQNYERKTALAGHLRYRCGLRLRETVPSATLVSDQQKVREYLDVL